ncbi:zinc finger protein 37 homolog isoform X2 [Mya arenaria]|uniref:zinc finger protein 37 homolog isoform X2 n=1 Tax=Mya arenaria TaxID=6604 RepID=UPI0022E705FE|nr:zinc finger protein 37 homolog isoform X2 [Mya arenaria]
MEDETKEQICPSDAIQNALEEAHRKQLLLESLEEGSGFTNSNDKEKKMYNCTICKKFVKKSYLNSHIITHTGETPFRCEFCNKGFNVRSNRNVHRRIHTGQRPHDCELCEKSFRQAGQLEYHMRFHRGEKPFLCPWCARSFRNSSGLTTHQRTHTGEKPFSCDVCQRSFSTSTSLKTHRVTHSGKMLFECPVCGREFNRKNNLNVHIKRHDKNRKYSCPECSNGFVMRAHVLKHLKKAHAIGLNEVKQKYNFLLEKSDCKEDEVKRIESKKYENNATRNCIKLIKDENGDTKYLTCDIEMKVENTKNERNGRNEEESSGTIKGDFPEEDEQNIADIKYNETHDIVNTQGSISDIENELTDISTAENGKTNRSNDKKAMNSIYRQAVVVNDSSCSRNNTHEMEGVFENSSIKDVMSENFAYNSGSEMEGFSSLNPYLTMNDTKLDINISVKSEPIFIEVADATAEDQGMGADDFTKYIKTEQRKLDDTVDGKHFLQKGLDKTDTVQSSESHSTMYLDAVIKQEKTDETK